MKMKKRITVYLLAAMGILLAAFFTPVKSTYAKTVQETDGVIMRDISVDTSGSDVPSEIKDPITKGTSLFGWLVISIGGLCLLAGIIMIAVNGITNGGHPGAGAAGWKVAIAGGVMILAPVLLSWLLPGFTLV